MHSNYILFNNDNKNQCLFSAKSDREMEIQENRRRKALMSTTSNMSRSSDPLKNPGIYFSKTQH